MTEERIEYEDGSVYVGEVKDGKEHGRGIETYPDGTRYEGEYKDGKKHGRGIFTFPDGSTAEMIDLSLIHI